MSFTLAEIPENALSSLGVTREQLAKLPRNTLQALLSGGRTSLLRLCSVKVPGSRDTCHMDGRLSLFRRIDNSVGMRLHAVNQLNHLTPRPNSSVNMQKQTGTTAVAADRKPEGMHGHILDNRKSREPGMRRTTEDKIEKQDPIDQSESPSRSKSASPKMKKPVVGDAQGDRSYAEPGTDAGRMGDSVRSVRFSHSRLEDTDLLLDISLLASGLGPIILLEHLADLALHMRLVKKPLPLRDPAVRNMLADSCRTTQSGRFSGELGRIGEALRERFQSVKAGILFSHDQQGSKDLEQNRQEQSKPHRLRPGIRS